MNGWIASQVLLTESRTRSREQSMSFAGPSRRLLRVNINCDMSVLFADLFGDLRLTNSQLHHHQASSLNWRDRCTECHFNYRMLKINGLQKFSCFPVSSANSKNNAVGSLMS
jgi:hypothetical protein